MPTVFGVKQIIIITGKIFINLLKLNIVFFQFIQADFKDDIGPVFFNYTPRTSEYVEFVTVRVDFNQIDASRQEPKERT